MTKEEAGIIRSNFNSINSMSEKEKGAAISNMYAYFCTDGNNIYHFQIANANFIEGGRKTTWLRPVTTITIQ
jgi:hypothetical protein